MRITEPLPNCFSIWLSAADSARFLFSSIGFFLVVDFVDFVMGSLYRRRIAQAETACDTARLSGRQGYRQRRLPPAPIGETHHRGCGKPPASAVRSQQPAVQSFDGEV